MPDIEEILEILQKNVDEARERVSHLLEEEGLREVSALVGKAELSCPKPHSEQELIFYLIMACSYRTASTTSW